MWGQYRQGGFCFAVPPKTEAGGPHTPTAQSEGAYLLGGKDMDSTEAGQAHDFLVYSAGFFDADGSVGVYFNRNTKAMRGGQFRLVAQIHQALWMPILGEWFKRWGGRLGQGKGGNWKWMVRRREALAFLRDVLPYLRKKRDQARLAIEFQESMKPGVSLSDAEFSWQKAVAEALKEMKRTSQPISGGLLEELKKNIA